MLLAWQSYSVWSMVQSCSVKARAIIAAADPLDREPPAALVSVIERNISLDELLSHLATTLLERYHCSGSRGTDWMIDQPTLAWHLRTTFGKTEVVALFASTANMGKQDTGMNRWARRVYKTDINLLEDEALSCLVWRGLGQSTIRRTPDRTLYLACPIEDPPPPPPPVY